MIKSLLLLLMPLAFQDVRPQAQIEAADKALDRLWSVQPVPAASRFSIELRTSDEFPKATRLELRLVCPDKDCTLIREACTSAKECTVTAYKPRWGLARIVKIRATEPAEMVRGRAIAAKVAEFSDQKIQGVLFTPDAENSNRIAQNTIANVVNPAWLIVPDPADMERYYPSRAANLHVFGWAALDCYVRDVELRDCRIVAASPLDYGFGEAGLRMVRQYRVDPRKGPLPGNDEAVRIRMDFHISPTWSGIQF